MKDLPPTTAKKLRSLVQIADDLRQGKDFPTARLTSIKSLCSAPEAAAKFALHIAKLAQQRMTRRPGHITPSAWTRY